MKILLVDEDRSSFYALMVLAKVSSKQLRRDFYPSQKIGIASGWSLPLLLLMAFLFGKFDYFYEKQKKLGKWLLKSIGLGGNGDASSSSD